MTGKIGAEFKPFACTATSGISKAMSIAQRHFILSTRLHIYWELMQGLARNFLATVLK
jgi:hypothetical protein